MNTKTLTTTLLPTLMLFVAFATAQCPQYTAPEIPAVYAELYAELHGGIQAMDLTLDQTTATLPAPAPVGANLTHANSNRGPDLIRDDALSGILLQLDGLQAIGITTVSIVMNFPVLHPDFFAQKEDHYKLLSLYHSVVDSVRSRGMKLIIVNVDALSKGLWAGWPSELLAPFYNLNSEPGFDFPAYRAMRAQVARLIAEEFTPDYLTLLAEPDTATLQTGIQELSTPAGSALLVSDILTELAAVDVPGMKKGAGVGNWQDDYLEFARQLVLQPLDYLDIHVYPVIADAQGNGLLLRLYELWSLATTHNKMVGISDAWLYKANAEELAETETIADDRVFARDKFSFWSPLDSYFIEVIAKFARIHQLEFFSPYGWGYFRRYIDFTPELDTLPLMESRDLWSVEYTDAISNAVFSETARRFSLAIVGNLDNQAPAAPDNLAANLVTTSSVAIEWNKATDNVGIAGYRVYRNGEWLADTGGTTFHDEELSQATVFSYAVSSFDLMCNESSPTAADSVTTPDLDPPSTPLHVWTEVTDSQIRVNWSPATDNAGVVGYRVFVGDTADTLNVATGTPDTTYLLEGLPPEHGVFFAIDAYDDWGNASNQTAPIYAETLPDTTAPSTPGELITNVLSETQIKFSWSASTDNVAVWSYRMYYGTAPDQLTLIGTTAELSYTIEGLRPNTTIYFSIDAVDTVGNASPQTIPLAARTLQDLTAPTTPTLIVVEPLSENALAVSWHASTDNVKVWRYLVSAGVAPSSLSPIAATELTQYQIQGLPPNTGLYIKIEAIDTSGNFSVPTVPVKGTSLPDLTAPTVPGNLMAQGLTNGRIDLSWSVSTDNIAVARYLLYVGTAPASLKLFAVSTTNSYTLSGLPTTPGYYFSVEAIDAAGNRSGRTGSVFAKPLADTVAPTVPANFSAVAKPGGNIQLSWEASSDNVIVYAYLVYLGVTADSDRLLASTKVQNHLISSLPAGLGVYLSVQAVDINGNRSAKTPAVFAKALAGTQ